MKKVNLDAILEQALEKALATLTARAQDVVEQALERALMDRIRALVGEIGTNPEVPATATAEAEVAQATPARARAKAKVAQATPATATAKADLDSILGALGPALAKYNGVHTPRGKSLPDVLFRRVKKVLEHAHSLGLGHQDLVNFAHRALAVIETDPMAAAMGSWLALATRLGLPAPIPGKGE
jgi:hypothetical protein